MPICPCIRLRCQIMTTGDQLQAGGNSEQASRAIVLAWLDWIGGLVTRARRRVIMMTDAPARFAGDCSNR